MTSVGSQHPQLARRAQFQLAAFVDVERLVGVVGLHPHTEAFFAALEQREAVAYVAGLPARACGRRTDRPTRRRPDRPAHQIFADLALQITLQRRTGGEVQPVQSYSGRPSRPARRMRATVMPLVASTGWIAASRLGFCATTRWLSAASRRAVSMMPPLASRRIWLSVRAAISSRPAPGNRRAGAERSAATAPDAAPPRPAGRPLPGCVDRAGG